MVRELIRERHTQLYNCLGSSYMNTPYFLIMVVWRLPYCLIWQATCEPMPKTNPYTQIQSCRSQGRYVERSKFQLVAFLLLK